MANFNYVRIECPYCGYSFNETTKNVGAAKGRRYALSKVPMADASKLSDKISCPACFLNIRLLMTPPYTAIEVFQDGETE